jgi:hypothetical protein
VGAFRKYVLRDAESQRQVALDAGEVLERFQAYRASHQPTGPDEHRLLNQSDREESGSEGTSLRNIRNISRGDRIRTCDIQLPKLAL